MKIGIAFIVTLLMVMPELGAQVIYERTFSPVFPSLEHPFQLSDTSTVSFANNTQCYFAHHVDDHIADNYFQLTYLLSAIHPVMENNLSIWPNPFHDYLETSQDFEGLKMYNSLGHVVSTGINRLDHLRSLAPGTYYVKGLKNQKSFFSRVIKIE